MGDRLACVVLPCLSLWYEPSWGVDYAMCKNVSDVSVDVSDVSESFKSCINVLVCWCGSLSVSCAVKDLLVTTNKVALRWLIWEIGWFDRPLPALT